MTLQDLLHPLEYSLIQGSEQTEITQVTENSKTADPGCLFFCRKGKKTSGFRYLKEILAAKAAAIVCDSLPDQELAMLLNAPVTVVVTADMDEMIRHAANRFYGSPQTKLTLIGVTGTKGKTTVTSMIYELLLQMGEQAVLIGTNGVRLCGEVLETFHTTPPLLSLYGYLFRAVQRHCRYAVIEVSSLAVKQGRIAGLSFNLGILTNFSPDHIAPGEHESLEEYRMWKQRFLSGCRCCILNLDDPWGKELSRTLPVPVITVSAKDGTDADVRAAQIVPRIGPGFWGSEFLLEGQVSVPISLAMPGAYNISNAIEAAAAAWWLGASTESLTGMLGTIQVAGRCQVAAQYRGAWLIVDYAHNESSMEAVLTMVKEYHPGRILCIFGCGGERSRLRRFGMGKVSARLADLTIVTQDNSRREAFSSILGDIMEGIRSERGECVMIPDRREAIRYGMRMARPGDFIFVFGKGHETYQEINGVRLPFSDVRTIQELKKETEAMSVEGNGRNRQ